MLTGYALTAVVGLNILPIGVHEGGSLASPLPWRLCFYMHCFLSYSRFLRHEESRCTGTITNPGGGACECAGLRDPILSLMAT